MRLISKRTRESLGNDTRVHGAKVEKLGTTISLHLCFPPLLPHTRQLIGYLRLRREDRDSRWEARLARHMYPAVAVTPRVWSVQSEAAMSVAQNFLSADAGRGKASLLPTRESSPPLFWCKKYAFLIG